jgi:hypothetical protein
MRALSNDELVAVTLSFREVLLIGRIVAVDYGN